MVSQKIKNKTLNFEGKEWCPLAQHWLCPNTGDDVLSLIREAMIIVFIPDYEFDIAEFLS